MHAKYISKNTRIHIFLSVSVSLCISLAHAVFFLPKLHRTSNFKQLETFSLGSINSLAQLLKRLSTNCNYRKLFSYVMSGKNVLFILLI